ncbi:pimeloyl-ACP methyl ester carboxylesterase [Bradyrhizobium japonicum]
MPRIDRDGVGIYYEVHGEGPPLLLTHGYSSTSAMWHGQVDALARDHKLILWDMRGHGQSDYPDDPHAYSETLTTDDMASILDAVGAERAIISGLSLGGYMSLAFYRAYPQRAPCPADHRHRPRLQEGRRARGLECTGACDRRQARP